MVRTEVRNYLAREFSFRTEPIIWLSVPDRAYLAYRAKSYDFTSWYSKFKRERKFEKSPSLCFGNVAPSEVGYS